MDELHNCYPGYDILKKSQYFPQGDCGEAFVCCEEKKNGELWVDGGEYSTQVNFCPFCGYRARVQVEWEPEQSKQEMARLNSPSARWLLVPPGCEGKVQQIIDNVQSGDVIYYDGVL